MSIEGKLRRNVHAADYRIYPDGSDVSAKLIALMDYLSAQGGGVVHFGPGVYRVKSAWARDYVGLAGVFGATVLMVPDGFDAQVLGNEGQGTGDSIDYFAVEGIVFDGNQAASPRAVASSAVAMNIASYFRARDCIFRNASGYGLAMQGQPGYVSGLQGPQLYTLLENCHFLDNGVGAGGDTYDGLDIKTCKRLTMVGCAAARNTDQGINVRGVSVAIIGGESCDNGSIGYGLSDNTNGDGTDTDITVTGATARGNDIGFHVAQTTVDSTRSVRVGLTGVKATANRLGVTSGAYNDYVELSIGESHVYGNTSHGVSLPQGAMKRFSIANSSINGNTGSGLATNGTDMYVDSCEIRGNARYGFEELGTGTRSVFSGATTILDNVMGSALLGVNRRTFFADSVRDYVVGVGDAIASDATITMPHTGDYFNVTGTTNISAITPSWRGRRITLHFSGVLQLQEGGNLALTSNPVNTSSADIVQLVCDGTNWIQCAPIAAN
jgi:hypothetical protein